MQADNRLTTEFIRRYPAAAARTLEHVSPGDVAAFLNEIESELSSELFRYLMPDYTERCISGLTDKTLDIYAELNPSALVRAMRRLNENSRLSTMERLSPRARMKISHLLEFPEMSVGSIMLTKCPVMHGNLTVENAIERLKKTHPQESNLIFTVDDEHKLIGVVNAEKLLSADAHIQLKSLMNKKITVVQVATQIGDMENHPGWRKYRQIPVIDKDRTYLGHLDYEVVQSWQEQAGNEKAPRDPFGGTLSLLGLYWLNVAWLLELFLSSKPSIKKSK
jgi:Mg/Co/Ni transporter MgtE